MARKCPTPGMRLARKTTPRAINAFFQYAVVLYDAITTKFAIMTSHICVIFSTKNGLSEEKIKIKF